MTLDPTRTTRDYLYGRLLAVAHYAERNVLSKSEENRPTNAERLMRKFAVAPYTTWPKIEEKLEPYFKKLQANNFGLYVKIQDWLNKLHNQFTPEDYTCNKPLEGEFLLGYHCQLADIYKGKDEKTKEITSSEEDNHA